MAELARGAIRARDLSRSYKLVRDRNLTLKESLLRRRRTVATSVDALRGVSFDVAPGEALGIIGKNGSGKSTLLKLLAGIIKPHTGEVQIGGTVASMLELGAGFHPDYSGRDNVYLNGSIYGLRRSEIDERFDDIVAFAEIPDFVDAPVRTYSSGMYMRLAFAIASFVNPDVLLLDEVLAVGDEAFQMKCMGRIFEYQQRGGTLLLVSHDPGAIERVCDRAILLDHGAVSAEGPTAEVLSEYHRQLAADGPSGFGGPLQSSNDDRVWGTGEVQITACRLVGPNGPAQRFMSGEHLSVEMIVVPNHPIEAPVYSVGISTVDGLLCFETSTRINAQPTDRLDAVTRVRFTVPSLPLHAGAFVVSLAVRSHDESVVYLGLDRWLPLDVFQNSPGQGIVRMSGAWEMEPCETEPLAPDLRRAEADV